jgi:dinuclear metal center YbgI/SA1388 family protein
MVHRNRIIEYLDERLAVDQFQDYSPNGLQVEGKEKIYNAVTAVSASLELFEKAADLNADIIIVHHGILWDRDERVIKNNFKRRLKTLFEHEISLLAYHLPLDKHPDIGNNAIAAKQLGMNNLEELGTVGLAGHIDLSIEELTKKVKQVFQVNPLIFSYGPDQIKKIGFCSGGAAKDLTLAIKAGLDAFITGEASEPTMHMAKEGNIHFIAAGHYATERFGIQALGKELEKKFNISVQFIDIPNPV